MSLSLSIRSTCLIACLVTEPLACASACPNHRNRERRGLHHAEGGARSCRRQARPHRLGGAAQEPELRATGRDGLILEPRAANAGAAYEVCGGERQMAQRS